MKIVVDTLGSDLGPEELVRGTINAMKNIPIDVVFVGNKKNVEQAVINNGGDPDRIEYIDTSVSIENTEDPVMAIRRKKEASIVLGLHHLNNEGVDGFYSTGSTGALLAGGMFITKRIEYVDRAALVVILPTRRGGTMMLDAGANMDTTPDFLYQFAIMGEAYAKKVLGVSKPKIGLLNVGVEEGKGDKRTKETYDLLKGSSMNFGGNVEARELLNSDFDVIVTDGFSGNIALKSFEGSVKLLFTELKEGLMGSARGKLGGLLLKPILKNIIKKYDYREHGSAPLLGTKKAIFKAHGSSDARAFENGLYIMEKFISNGVIQEIEKNLSEVQHD